VSWPDDEFDELAAELRRRVGAEFVMESAEIEQLAEQQRRRRADLAESARRAMHRGDRVTVTCQTGRWSGQLWAVGDDYLVLEAIDTWIEAYLPSVGLEIEPARSGGRSGSPASVTWRARLTELELEGDTVTVVAPPANIEVTGRIEVVAADHIVLATGDRRSVLPITMIAVMLRQR
jgi:hypothetical protein